MKTTVLSTLFGLTFFAFGAFNANAQYDYGTDSAECVKNYSLYKEYYEQKSYKDAYSFWLTTYKVCPKFHYVLYKHGVTIVEEVKIKGATDPKVQKEGIDTLMMLYDQWIEHFPEKKGYVYGKKGVDAYSFKMYEVAYESLKKSLEIEGEESQASPVLRYFQAVIRQVQDGKLDSVAIFEAYDFTQDILEKRMKSVDEKYKKYYQNASENIEKLFMPFATCDAIETIYSKKYNTNPDDLEMLKKAIQLMDYRKCTDRDFYGTVAKKLYELEPSATAAVAIARMEYTKDNIDESVKYYKEAIAAQSDDTEKALYHFELAQILYAKKSDYSGARSNALKAASLKSGWGQPYILIGDMYYHSKNSCGADACEKKFVYWAAYDKYAKAKAVDPSIAAKADESMARARSQFATVDDCFFKGLTEDGKQVTIGCWINETTTTRFKK